LLSLAEDTFLRIRMSRFLSRVPSWEDSVDGNRRLAEGKDRFGRGNVFELPAWSDVAMSDLLENARLAAL